MRIFLPLIFLLIGYLLATPLTSLVSLDMRQTEWTNLLTYFWILGSWIAWLVIVVIGWIVWERVKS